MNGMDTDRGEWFKPKNFKIDEMIKAMKDEKAQHEKTARYEKERFKWRSSLVMVKSNGSIHINNMDEEKREFFEQFRK